EILRPTAGRAGRLSEFRVRDKSIKPLEALYNTVKSTGAHPLRLSPSGEWLLCRKAFMHRTKDQAGRVVASTTVAEQFFAVNVHDLQVVCWPKIQLLHNGPYLGATWMTNGSSLVTISGNEILILRLSRPGELKRIPFPSVPPGIRMLAAFPDG